VPGQVAFYEHMTSELKEFINTPPVENIFFKLDRVLKSVEGVFTTLNPQL